MTATTGKRRHNTNVLKEYTGLLTLVSRVIMIATGRSAVRLARPDLIGEVRGLASCKICDGSNHRGVAQSG